MFNYHRDPVCGRETIIAAYQNNPRDRLSRHLVSNVHITPLEAGVAHSVSYVTLYSATESGQETTLTGWSVQRAVQGGIPRCLAAHVRSMVAD
ncbi:hypothetical protein G8770_12575 [Aestuariicella hydrocarbonica]|uniref:SnoaL-like domain-containing protein n=1 Tax=Pseudomaricurvus hydrocarbonicus TaxID=1470433 RepID=A0A9E5JTQ5_9GAMM|nr:hypothetical protein [Aestuariicella hydrocarbonica]NHO66374.1 hypothetical protein [Aestuariicella hydrocarbonica]